MDVDADGDTGNLLWTNHWLLAYEAQYYGWLDSTSHQFKPVNNNQFFKKLMDLDINFYDANYKITLTPTQKKQSPLIKSTIKQYIELIESAVEKDNPTSIEEVKKVNANLLSKIDNDIY